MTEPEETCKQEDIRDDSGRFRKGISGNPTGRPRVLLTVRGTLGQHVPKAAERLAWLVENGETHQVQLAAIKELLNRTIGIPRE